MRGAIGAQAQPRVKNILAALDYRVNIADSENVIQRKAAVINTMGFCGPCSITRTTRHTPAAKIIPRTKLLRRSCSFAAAPRRRNFPIYSSLELSVSPSLIRLGFRRRSLTFG